MLTLTVVAAVSGALVLGALWGAYLPLTTRLKGFLTAMAGGALITSLTFELLEPAIADAGWPLGGASLLAGAAVFTIVDYLLDETWGPESGGGLLAAVTLDGIPENLALGVALIGATLGNVLALAASIFLSNLPEAAAGAAEMAERGSRPRALGLWAGAAAFLAVAALTGNLLLAGAPSDVIAVVKSFAGGAVIASLATEVFPTAFRDDAHEAGVAAAVGLLIAFALV